MSTSSTTVRNLPSAAIFCILLVLLAVGIRANECSSIKGLASNYTYSLVGKKDTLWVLVLKDASVAFSMIAGKTAFDAPTEENNWWSYSPDCMGEYENLMYDGGIYALASFDTVDNQLWVFNHETGRDRRISFKWPGVSDSVPDSLYLFYCINAVRAQERFYLACNDGGLVLWDPADSRQTVFFPGNETSYSLSQLKKADLVQREKPDENTDERVIDVHHLHDDSVLIVVTESKLWIHMTADSSWDSSITSDFNVNTVTFKRYENVFINTLTTDPVLYGTITVRFKNEKEDSTVFCKYNPATDKWGIMFDSPPKSLTFGHRRTIYALFDEERPGGALRNIIRIFRDGDDTAVTRNPKTVSIDNDIHKRMTAAYDIDSPETFNDVLYIPRSDTSGYLWIATSEGLFVAKNEVAGKDNTSAFTLVKLAPKLSAGLKKTYARPGIISPGISDCTFIYNIKADEADVTIRVFDYNMDHVKTIIHKQRRFSGTNGGPLGRSTVESEDRWNGKNAQGRDCAPGLYYYKITTSSGERAFGKIVIAR